MLDLIVFKSSSKLYSSSWMTVSFCGRVLPLLGTSVEGGGSQEGFPMDLVLWGCWKLKTVLGSYYSLEKKLTVLTYWYSSSCSCGGCESWFVQSSEDSRASCVLVARDFKIEKIYFEVSPSLGLGGGGFWVGLLGLLKGGLSNPLLLFWLSLLFFFKSTISLDIFWISFYMSDMLKGSKFVAVVLGKFFIFP